MWYSKKKIKMIYHKYIVFSKLYNNILYISTNITFPIQISLYPFILFFFLSIIKYCLL